MGIEEFNNAIAGLEEGMILRFSKWCVYIDGTTQVLNKGGYLWGQYAGDVCFRPAMTSVGERIKRVYDCDAPTWDMDQYDEWTVIPEEDVPGKVWAAIVKTKLLGEGEVNA